MPSSSPAQAPVRSIALGSNFSGFGVQIAATARLGPGVEAGEADDVGDMTAADTVVVADAVADGVGDAVEPQAARQAQRATTSTR